jgi:proliferating cell nuclear antigen
MEAQFDTTLFIRNIFDSISDLIPSVRLEIRKDGWNICCVETNGCCIVSMFISKDDMKPYKITKETDIVIQLPNILKKLKEMDKCKSLKIKYKEDGDRLYFSQTKGNGRASEHQSCLLSVDIDTSVVPDIKNYAEVNFQTEELSKILKILSISSEVCKISSLKNKQSLVFSSCGEFDSGREVVPIPDDDSFIIDNHHDSFSIPYMIKFMKASALSNEAKICLSKDNPICIKYKFENSFINYYLSPKVADDDEEDEEVDEKDVKIDMIKLDSGSDSEYEEILVTDNEESEDEDNVYKEEIISDSE